ncbi:hypothetical protein [Nocardia asiatica]|uniref:hypothetical protein n=1 Tax=Nocardia asiatica TaxID=209252 RepID=UPI003EE3ADB8
MHPAAHTGKDQRAPAAAVSAKPAQRPRAGPGVPSGLSPAAALALQRAAGNGATVRALGMGAGTQRLTPDPAAVLGTTPATASADGPGAGHGVQRDSTAADQAAGGTAPSGAGGGVLGWLRRQVDSIGGGVQSGWNRLSDTAQAVTSAVTSRAGVLAQQAGAAATRLAGTLESGWDRIRAGARALTRAVTDRLGHAVGGLAAAFATVRDAVAAMNLDGIEAGWTRLIGSAGGVAESAAGAETATTQRVSAAETQLDSQSSSVTSAVAAGAATGTSAVREAGAAADGTTTARWGGVTELGGRLTALEAGVPGFLRGAASRLLSPAKAVWSGIGRRWDSLRAGLRVATESATASVSAAWAQARTAAGAAAGRVSTAWAGVRSTVTGRVTQLVSGARSLAQRVSGFSISSVTGKLRGYLEPLAAIRSVIAAPATAMEPYAAPLAGQLSSAMPAEAETTAHLHAPGPAGAPANGPVVQRWRDPAAAAPARSTSSLGELWAGLRAAFREKWAQVDVKKMVLDSLVSIVWPWPKIGAEIHGIVGDFKTVAGTLFMPRNPFAHPLGALHDLWSDLMHLADFPLTLWRRLNNIGLLLLGPITIALTVIGFVGGSLAGTVLGGIAGALAGVGIGAVPGAGAGLGAGGAAGAGAGFGVALGLGQAFLVSFAAGETTALIKALGDLLAVRQTRDEKLNDYSTTADSAIALAITGILVGLGWIGGRIAGAIAGVIRRFLPRSVLAVLDEFASGVRAARGEVPAERDDASAGSAEAVPGKIRLRARFAQIAEGLQKLRGQLDAVDPGHRPDLRARIDALEHRMNTLSAEAEAATSAAEVESIKKDMNSELARNGGISADVAAAAGENGPYRGISDRTEIRPGRDFTDSQKRKIKAANKARNGGVLMSDDPLDPHQVLSESVRATGNTDKNLAGAEVDHIVSADKGGTNSYGNARVVSAEWNNLKRNH